jgi:uncharacterized protein YcbK (DUF882 family)
MWAGTADASAEIRSLDIYHMHTGEHEVIVFKRDGVYDQQGLNELNHILRDWRRNETIKMDPALFDLIYEVYRDAGASGPIQIVCGYRAPETNNMLRARSRGVAQFSQHTLGKAMDFFLPGVPLEKLREVGMKKQIGGVGFYPTSGSPFVHMDTGGVRAWPRMTHDQLVRLFPDGKTLHLPSDGGPLPGYNQALAEYQRRQPGQTQVADNSSARSSSKNPIAAFFGIKSGEEGGDEEEAAQAPVPTRSRAPAQAVVASNMATVQPKPLPAPQPLKSSLTSNLPHLASKPIDQNVGPMQQQPEKPSVATNLPLPPTRPALQQTAMAATPVSVPQPGSLMPLAQQQPARAPGAILRAGWTTGPSGTAPPQAAPQTIASLKSIDVPLPLSKPQGVIGAVPRPRPPVATASLGSRPINDAFAALTGIPGDSESGTLLGYAPVATPMVAQEPPRATSVARDQSAHLRLASLGGSDVVSTPAPTIPQSGKQSRFEPDTLAKTNRGDPMARLISHVTEEIDVRFLDTQSSLRSALTATFVHPDQDAMQQMIVKPTQVLAYSFNSSPAQLTTDRFVGPSVVALAVIETH